jgi:nucleoside-diphosphate-sugar epimerase
LISAIVNDECFSLYLGSADHARAFTYVGDVVNAFDICIDKCTRSIGETINIGSEISLGVMDAIATVEEVIGRKARLTPMRGPSGAQLVTKANIDKAKQLLGFYPAVRLREGIQTQVNWFLSHGKD